MWERRGREQEERESSKEEKAVKGESRKWGKAGKERKQEWRESRKGGKTGSEGKQEGREDNTKEKGKMNLWAWGGRDGKGREER